MNSERNTAGLFTTELKISRNSQTLHLDIADSIVRLE